MAIVKGKNNPYDGDTLDKSKGVTDHADLIFGYDGYDHIYGEGGDDILKGGGGADDLHGGWGSDWADYSDSPLDPNAGLGIHVNLMDNFAHFGTAEGDTFDSIENVSGSNYDDLITGNNEVNHLQGGGGNDHLTGAGGGDRLDGGAGFDFAEYWTSNQGVTVSLNNGYTKGGDAKGDTFVSIEGLAGTGFDDHFTGNDVDNTLIGYGGDDTLKGYGGNDRLEGGYGVDVMDGGAGNDTYLVDEYGDAVFETSGNGYDTVFSDISYVLPANVERVNLTDEGGAVGAIGNALDNWIVGNDGANAINGLGGKDYLFGEEGADRYVFSSDAHLGDTAATGDVIGGFSFADGDRIDLSLIDADVYAMGNQAFTFIGMNDFTPDAAHPGDFIAGEIRYYHADGNTYIELQTGHGNDVEGVICLTSVVDPQMSWFVL